MIKFLKSTIDTIQSNIDKIPDKVFQISADIIAPSLTAIFDLSLHTGIFVCEWKLARIMQPIYKSEDKNKRENYRPWPISVFTVVSKKCKKEIYPKIHLFPRAFQSGFRAKFSTLTLLLQMCDKWQESVNEGKIIITY